MDFPNTTPRRWPALLITLLALAAGGCTPGAEERRMLNDFAAAVQGSDWEALFCLSAGAAEAVELGADGDARREAFGDWARGEVAAYLDGRDEGWVELTGHGIRLVKLFAIGKGAFNEFLSFRSAGGGRIASSRVRFGYAHLNLSSLVPGTTFYLSGAPPGRVHPIVVPAFSTRSTADVLEQIDLEWTLVRQDPTENCANRWAVAGVVPVEDSAVVTSVSWEF